MRNAVLSIGLVLLLAIGYGYKQYQRGQMGFGPFAIKFDRPEAVSINKIVDVDENTKGTTDAAAAAAKKLNAAMDSLSKADKSKSTEVKDKALQETLVAGVTYQLVNDPSKDLTISQNSSDISDVENAAIKQLVDQQYLIKSKDPSGYSLNKSNTAPKDLITLLNSQRNLNSCESECVPRSDGQLSKSCEQCVKDKVSCCTVSSNSFCGEGQGYYRFEGLVKQNSEGIECPVGQIKCPGGTGNNKPFIPSNAKNTSATCYPLGLNNANPHELMCVVGKSAVPVDKYIQLDASNPNSCKKCVATRKDASNSGIVLEASLSEDSYRCSIPQANSELMLDSGKGGCSLFYKKDGLHDSFVSNLPSVKYAVGSVVELANGNVVRCASKLKTSWYPSSGRRTTVSYFWQVVYTN